MSPVTSPPFQIPADVPIALLPVRLETRYFANELRIRIYPDAIHVDSHEPALTALEIEHGTRYWTAFGAAGADVTAQRAAWDALTAEHGVARSAWIARATRSGPPGGTPAPSGWGRAPLARLLPTRWRAAGYRTWGELVYLEFDVAGNEITTVPEVGPNPSAGTPPTLPDDQPLVTPGMRWMVDYEAARVAGMAITVPFSVFTNPTLPIDYLIVYGVDESGGTQPALADLLQAHHYTDGFGFVDPGTPTNNTDLARSGHDPAGDATSERYRVGDGTTAAPPPISEGGVAGALARALGMPAAQRAVLARDPAGARVDRQADMNALTWPSSWGYFLTQILEGVPLPAVGAVRRHFVDNVRAGGALPLLRVGDQPYGVLPVVSLQAWQSRGEEPVHDQVVALLKRALPVWLEASWKATVGPRPFRPVKSPGERYFELLAMQATAVGHAGRSALGPEYIGNLWRFVGLDFDRNWRVTPRALANRLLDDLGLPMDQRHTGTVYAEEAFDVDAPAVGSDPATYLATLAAATPAQLAAAGEHGTATPLLYRIARHSALQAWWNAVLLLRGGDRRYLEQELIDLDPLEPPTTTLWRALAEPAPGGGTVEAYLGSAPASDPVVADLRELRARLTALAGAAADGSAPAAALEEWLRGSLDLAAHRLDAWISSYAHRRLDYLRAPERQPAGVIAGGYGWLVNVRPATLTPVGQPPKYEPPPLYSDPENAGHVLAPSLQHAVTAAVLHAGYVARGGRADNPGAVAVDLDAERVRLVRHLIEGARAGQSLNALLGYRFERALSEGGASGVPQMILPFRLLAPYRAQQLTPGGAGAELASTADVADGVELVRRWHANGIPWGTAPDPAGHPGVTLPGAGTPEQARCEAALARAAGGLDALADAALAEGVHQLVGGNPARAGAALDALGKGAAPPPDLDVIRTPRTGVTHAHRLLFLGSLEAADYSVWPTDGRQLRAAIEPVLNSWAGRMLGDPARVRCRGVWRRDGAVVASAEITLDALRLSPLDLIALARADRPEGAEELRQRCIDSLRALRPPAVPDEIMAEPDFGRQPAWPLTTLSVAEFLQLVRAVREALLGARPLRADDLAAPGEQRALQWSLADLTNRVTASRNSLTTARAALTAAVTAGDIGGMGGQLTSLAYVGLSGVFPRVGVPWSDAWREELRGLSRTALDEVGRRLATEADLAALPEPPDATDAQRVERLVERLRALLGADFPVAPLFTVTDAAGLSELLSHSGALLGADALAPATWLDRLARVRPGAARLHAVLQLAEATSPSAPTDLTIAQVPFVAGESWIARESAAAGPRTSIAVHGIRPLNASAALAGLVFDDWTELVPNASEVAGLTFHYNAPDARAPQSILLALPAGHDGAWSPELLRNTVREALDLARARAVDLPTLDQFGHLLPALYFGLNDTGATASTDFLGHA